MAILAATLAMGGCGARPPVASPSSRPMVRLSIQRPEHGTRVFSSEEEVSSSFPFEGAGGSVRVTMEVEKTSSAPGQASTTVNDVLFRAEGDGKISIGFKRPSPGHHEGRVTIRCLSGGEESEAEFEPEIWMSHPSAIVTFEPIPADFAHPVVEGREVVLVRYLARNMPIDIRLTLKALFSKEPVPPRVKAGPKRPGKNGVRNLEFDAL
jgi:hypothetical protein